MSNRIELSTPGACAITAATRGDQVGSVAIAAEAALCLDLDGNTTVVIEGDREDLAAMLDRQRAALTPAPDTAARGTVDTRDLTDDFALTLDRLTVDVFHAARVTLDEAKHIASALLGLYEQVNKASDVEIYRHDIDSEVFEAVLMAVAELRDHN